MNGGLREQMHASIRLWQQREEGLKRLERMAERDPHRLGHDLWCFFIIERRLWRRYLRSRFGLDVRGLLARVKIRDISRMASSRAEQLQLDDAVLEHMRVKLGFRTALGATERAIRDGHSPLEAWCTGAIRGVRHMVIVAAPRHVIGAILTAGPTATGAPVPGAR